MRPNERSISQDSEDKIRWGPQASHSESNLRTFKSSADGGFLGGPQTKIGLNH